MNSAGNKGVGARLRRKEDARFLHGQGEFVPNIAMVGMQNVAFVRSSVAHGRIKSITKPVGFEDAVFTIDDLVDVKPIVANSSLPGFKASSSCFSLTELAVGLTEVGCCAAAGNANSTIAAISGNRRLNEANRVISFHPAVDFVNRRLG